MEASRTAYEADLRLARAVASGSLESWHEFVQRYSSLIFSVVCRYLVDGDYDARRDTYVDILEHLYRHEMSRYDGRAALSTWVITVSRSRCMDELRNRFGRRREPTWLRGLSKLDQEVYRRYYLDLESFPRIAEAFRSQGRAFGREEFARALDRIESHMDRRQRTRMAYDLQARSVGAVSGRLLELVHHLRIEQEAIAETAQPDFDLLQSQARVLLEKVGECVRRLEAQEQRIIRLHYYSDLPARRIAKELDLPGTRRVYTLIDRALSHLRAMLRPQLGPRLEGAENSSAAPRGVERGGFS